jgi:NAD(P)-dependent dehydrogenase (short-subunit alcohol dehydrogenase family)
MTTTVITGANRGIGFELARQTAARGDTVIAVCREPGPALEALNIQIESGIDVSAQEDVDELARRLADMPIDLLINNAGILSRQSLDDLDFDEMRRQFEVNSLGPLRVTATLRSQLKDGAKVAIVSSRMGSIADNTSGGHYGYRMSKAAVNMAGVSLARDLRDRDISVILLHPGFVSTEMTNLTGDVEPADAAAGLLKRIDELTLRTSGTWRHANGEELPW